MLLVLFAIIFGVGAAIAFDLYVPPYLISYIGIVIISAVDSVMGAYKSLLRERFDPLVFATGFFGNSLMAALMVFWSKKIEVDIYYAVVVVFTIRIFNNFSFIRRYYLKKIRQKLKKC